MYSLHFIRQLPHLCARHLGGTPSEHDIGFRETGYSFMASSDEGAAILAANIARQNALGATWIEALSPTQLHEVFPWCKHDDILLASRSTQGEGIFDPWRLISVLKSLCKVAGVEFVQGEVTDVTSVTTSDHRAEVRAVHITGSDSPTTVPCDVMVNAAGPHAAAIMAPLNIDLPVRARKRHVFSFKCGAAHPPPTTTPLTVDPSGVYFRPELAQATFIAGVSPPVGLKKRLETEDYSISISVGRRCLERFGSSPLAPSP